MSLKPDDGVALDLLIILDCTSSMGEYIKSAKKSIVEICCILRASGRLRRDDGLQVGLVAYRDYPKEDNRFVVEEHPFTFDLKVMEGYLGSLEANGGGDPPEAFSTALDFAYYRMVGWRDEALKAIIVVTDAAPHGINEDKDVYPNGVPDGEEIKDPLRIAKDMVEAGYSIFTLACEPRLGKTTKYAIDFYKALSDRTLGKFCSLTDHKLLPAYIIGALLEKIDLRRLSKQYQEDIRKDILEDGASVDDVVRKLHEKLTFMGQQVTNLQTADVYHDIPDANENYRTFMNSDSLANARPHLKQVKSARIDESRLKIIQRSKHETEDSFTVSVQFRNLGEGKIVLKTFDASLSAMHADKVVSNGHIIQKRFSINIPVNFTVELGRHTKNFCKVFVNDTTIDVNEYFV